MRKSVILPPKLTRRSPGMMRQGPDRLAPDPARPGREQAVVFGLIALVGLGLWSLGTATGWAEIGAQLARLQPWQVAALLALSAGNYLLRSLRWHGLARRLGLPTGFAQNLRHYFGGFALSVTPGRLGELVRMRWLKRETGWAPERTAPLALMDRAGDLAALHEPPWQCRRDDPGAGRQHHAACGDAAARRDACRLARWVRPR